MRNSGAKQRASIVILDTKTAWVINLWSYTLNQLKHSALQKDLNLAVAPGHIPKTELIAGVEVAVHQCMQINGEMAGRTRATIASIIHKAKPLKPNLEKMKVTHYPHSERTGHHHPTTG